ncbi:MAG: hypothetical protein R2807_07760 [Chitinophagales bacterium]
MQHLYTLNFENFTSKELCSYLEDRMYIQVISNIENSKKYVFELMKEDDSQSNDLINSLLDILEKEIKQLFTKDRMILFPNLISQNPIKLNIEPINEIHKRINRLLEKIRYLLNNFVVKPDWTSTHKICCNELYNLEQSILYVFYVKENFLWTKINLTNTHAVVE